MRSFPTGAARPWKTSSPRACRSTSRQAVRGQAFSLNQTDHAQGHILPDVETWLRLGIGGLRSQVQAASRRWAGNPGRRSLLRGVRHCPGCRGAVHPALRRAGRAAGPRRNRPGAPPRAARYRRALPLAGRAPGPQLPRGAAGDLVPLCAAADRIQRQQLLAGPPGPVPAALPGGRSGRRRAGLWPPPRNGWSCSGSSSTRSSCCAAAAAPATLPAFPSASTSSWAGRRRDGGDATNLLSFMCLRAQADLGLTQPNLSIRIHRDSPQEFLRRGGVRDRRGQRDAPGLQRRGHHPRPGPARRGPRRTRATTPWSAASSCPTPGKALGWSDASMFNMTRVLELTLFGGRDPQTGEQIGLATPAARSDAPTSPSWRPPTTRNSRTSSR